MADYDFWWVGWWKSSLRRCAKIRKNQQLICPWCGQLHKTFEKKQPNVLFIRCPQEGKADIFVAINNRVVLNSIPDLSGSQKLLSPPHGLIVAYGLVNASVFESNNG